MSATGSITERVDGLLNILRTAAETDYIGEPVSQLEHALQAAGYAQQAGARDELILAALFHDIGHLIAPDSPKMGSLGAVFHERIGAEHLRAMGCSEDVALLVDKHVDAKRYLCARNSVYLRRLSPASTGTLEYQGGPMTAEETARFEAQPLFREILRMRSWDEKAKDPDAVVPELEAYRDMLTRHLERPTLPGA